MTERASSSTKPAERVVCLNEELGFSARLEDRTSCRRRERLNTIFADAIEPDQAVLNLHFDSNVAQPVFVFTESFAS